MVTVHEQHKGGGGVAESAAEQSGQGRGSGENTRGGGP